MKRILMRALGILAGVLFLAISAAGFYVAATWDRVWDAPMPDLHASRDPAVINRGEYLAFGPAHCVECHVSSTEEYDKALDSGTRPALVGGMKFAAPPLGVIYSRNITPDVETGIGRYTDGQLARMLRYSVRPDGHASVQLLMPYGDMSGRGYRRHHFVPARAAGRERTSCRSTSGRSSGRSSRASRPCSSPERT